MCTEMECRFSCEVESVPKARHAVAEALDEAGLDHSRTRDTRDNALLVAGEMLSNAARACRDKLCMRIEVHRTWLKIEVEDDSPSPPVRRSPDAHGIHGRGVDIIAKLSDEWGHSPWNGSHKTVWSRLNLPSGVALPIPCGGH